MDELYKIRAFLEVFECGSFSEAARRHDVSVSSVARRIASLEEDLGVRLVNRNTRGLSVTEAGQAFYERVHGAVRDLDSAKVVASSFQESVKGMLRISLRVSVGVMVLPKLQQFLERYPDVSIDLDLTDARVDILQNNIDVAVWIGRLSDSELVAKRLSRGRRVLCASPGYLSDYGVPAHPNDLADHKCLTFRSTDYDGDWRFSKDDESWTITPSGPFRSSSGLGLMQAALSGMGIVVLQHYMIERELRTGELRPIMTDFEVSPTDADSSIYAVYPHSRYLSLKARAFIDFLLECFREPHDAVQPEAILSDLNRS